MQRQQARKVIEAIDPGIIQAQGDLAHAGHDNEDVAYIRWEKNWETIAVEGAFTPLQLEAIASWVRHQQGRNRYTRE